MRKPPARRYTPRAISNIRNDLSSWLPAEELNPESLYSAIEEIFRGHSQERTAQQSNSAETWLNLIPAALR